ncbi:hypothetical protein BN1723_020421, partial [Verticillium longisporum]
SSASSRGLLILLAAHS